MDKIIIITLIFGGFLSGAILAIKISEAMKGLLYDEHMKRRQEFKEKKND